MSVQDISVQSQALINVKDSHKVYLISGNIVFVLSIPFCSVML